MGLLWDGKHQFEGGDVVRVKEGHPFAGVLGVVTALFDRQFEVTSKEFPGDIFAHGAGRMWLWGDDLELVNSHKTQVPEVFTQ